MARDVRVAIIGDPSSLQRALRTSETAVQGFNARLAAVGDRMRSVGSSMTRNMTLPLVGFGIVAYRELSESQRVLAQTQAVIESTGGAAQRSVGDIEELVTSLRDVSGVDDEGIQDMANTLLTFRGIVGDVFDEASAATLDLSVAMDRDLRSSAVMVGRALNDPMRGLSALTRVGVAFTQEQRDMVAMMTYFGDTAGAQRVILEELNAEFGGSAEAVGATLQGRLGRVRQQFEDMAASVLEDLLPALEDLAGVVTAVADAYGRLTPTQQKFVAGLVAAAFVAGPLLTVLGGIASALSAVGGALAAVSAVAAAAISVVAVLAFGLVFVWQNWQTVQNVANTALSAIRGNVPGASTVVRELGVAVQAVKRGFDAVRSTVGPVISAVVRFGQTNVDGLLRAINAIADGLRTVLNLAQQAASAVTGVRVVGAQGDASGGAVGGRSRVSESFIARPDRSRGGVTSGPMGTPAEIGRAVARELARTPQPVYALNGG